MGFRARGARQETLTQEVDGVYSTVMRTPLMATDAVHPWDASVALVLSGHRSFLVVGLPEGAGSVIFEWKERDHIRPSVWVSRGTSMAIDPEVAVTGMLLGPGSHMPDAIETVDLELRRIRRAAGATRGMHARDIKAKITARINKDAKKARRHVKP